MTAKGFVQLNVQVTQKCADKLEIECEKLGMKKGEFLNRMITMYFVAQELGMARDIWSFFMECK